MGGRGGATLPATPLAPLLVEVVEAGLAMGGGTTVAPAGVAGREDFVIDLGVVFKLAAKVGVAE